MNTHTTPAANRNREHAAILGAGAAACAVCCAGPILGFLAALGIGTATGIALFGLAGLAAAALAAIALSRRRRRRRSAVCTPSPATTPVAAPTVRTPR